MLGREAVVDYQHSSFRCARNSSGEIAMRIDRANHVAAAVQVKHRAPIVRAWRRDPFRPDPTGVHRLALDVGGDRKKSCHLVEVRARLLDRRMSRDRLRLEHLNYLLELLLRHRFTSPMSFADGRHLSRPDYSAAPRVSAKPTLGASVCRFRSRSSTVGNAFGSREVIM